MPILGSEVTQSDLEQMLAFYKMNFDVVEIVSCSECKSPLCFQLSAPKGEVPGISYAEDGKARITIGDKLLSWRLRLDEASTGEPMIGYQCACGNDTRIAAIERGKVPVAKFQQSLSPFEKFKIAEEIKASDHKADFKQQGNIKHFESFKVERVN